MNIKLASSLLCSLLLSIPTYSLGSDRKKTNNPNKRYLSDFSDVVYPAIFSSPKYPIGSDLHQFIATQLDILEVNDNRVFYLVTNEETLADYNLYIPEIIAETQKTEALNVAPETYRSSYSARNDYPTISDEFSCIRSLEGSYQTIAALEAQYPSLVEVINIGKSFLGEYDIELMKLTNEASTATKSHLFVTCALHVRELSTAEACTRFSENMLSKYGSDADITWIMDHTNIHIVLQSNPDGRKDEESEVSNGVYYYRRKNMNFDPSSNVCFPSEGGVDLNRNFPHSAWGTAGISSNLCASTYPGTSAGSEPEVDAIVKYVESVLPPGTNIKDGDGTYTSESMGVFMDIHSYGEDFFYPWGYKDENPPNHVDLVAMAKKLASHTTPKHSSNNEVYATSGDSSDWAYESIGVAAYTMELGNNFYQSCSYFESYVAPSAYKALLYAARVSKAPYVYPKGPDIMSITLLSDNADNLNVKVKASDSLRADGYDTGSQDISEISVFLNVHPYDVSSTAASVSNSGFSSSTEVSTLRVDVSSLAEGQHTIYVQAKDTDGTAGPIYASYFTIPLNYESDDPDGDVDDFDSDNEFNDGSNDDCSQISTLFQFFTKGGRYLRSSSHE